MILAILPGAKAAVSGHHFAALGLRIGANNQSSFFKAYDWLNVHGKDTSKWLFQKGLFKGSWAAKCRSNAAKHDLHSSSDDVSNKSTSPMIQSEKGKGEF